MSQEAQTLTPQNMPHGEETLPFNIKKLTRETHCYQSIKDHSDKKGSLYRAPFNPTNLLNTAVCSIANHSILTITIHYGPDK